MSFTGALWYLNTSPIYNESWYFESFIIL